ncbi:uncharacterized protein [Aristolochia californica]|uniref:uncharacterized protein n=1 Tax=Aristolochia californica TaxID=171875 RepID=UPI0035E37D72
MKLQYDQHHRDVQYLPDDFVWLHLQPYRQHSIAGTLHKLSPKYFGPFRILQRVGHVAYQLQLPPESQLHDIFHVSLLKPLRGPAPQSIPALPPIADGKVSLTPIKVLKTQQLADNTEILVQWSHTDTTDTTSKNYRLIRAESTQYSLLFFVVLVFVAITFTSESFIIDALAPIPTDRW